MGVPLGYQKLAEFLSPLQTPSFSDRSAVVENLSLCFLGVGEETGWVKQD